MGDAYGEENESNVACAPKVPFPPRGLPEITPLLLPKISTPNTATAVPGEVVKVPANASPPPNAIPVLPADAAGSDEVEKLAIGAMFPLATLIRRVALSRGAALASGAASTIANRDTIASEASPSLSPAG
jgi:hypothetical protein